MLNFSLNDFIGFKNMKENREKRKRRAQESLTIKPPTQGIMRLFSFQRLI
jgi:hypothetical protein